MSEQHRAVGRVKEVTSLSNPLVKDIRALALKKFRDREGAFIAEGLKLVIDALDQGWSIRTLVFAKTGLGNPSVEKAAARTVAAGGTVLANSCTDSAISAVNSPASADGASAPASIAAGSSRASSTGSSSTSGSSSRRPSCCRP